MPDWSLARIVITPTQPEEKVGLVPNSHYVLTNSLELSPQVIATSPPIVLPSLPILDDFSTTPQAHSVPLPASPYPANGVSTLAAPREEMQPLAPISPQITGTSPIPHTKSRIALRSSLNRFSSFVTSGAEEFLIHGSKNDQAPSTRARRNASSASQGVEDMWTLDRPEVFFTEVCAPLNPCRIGARRNR